MKLVSIPNIIHAIQYNMHSSDVIAAEEVARAKRKHNLDHKQVMELCRHFGILTEDVAAVEHLMDSRNI